MQPLTPERFVGTADWLSRMSASKSAVVLGYGNPKHSSPKALYLAMRDPARHARPDSAESVRGTVLEAAYIELWYRKNPRYQRIAEGEVRFDRTVGGYPFVATPDGQALDTEVGRDVGIECKTTNGKGHEYSQWGEPGTDVIPNRYMVQVQFQQALSGIDRTIVIKAGPYIDDVDTYIVDHNPDLARVILDRCVEFMRCVDLGLPPANDGAPATFEAVKRQNPDILRDTEGEDWPVNLDLAIEYIESLAGFEKFESRLGKAKSDLFEAMGKARRAIVETPPELGRNGKPKKPRPIVVASRQVSGKGVTLVKPRTPVDVDRLRALRDTAAAPAA